MSDLAARRVRREDEERNARAVAEEVERLDEARVPIAAGLVPGDEHRGLGLELRIGLERIEDIQDVRLEQVDLRALRMTVEQPVRLADRDRRKIVLLDRRDQV